MFASSLISMFAVVAVACVLALAASGCGEGKAITAERQGDTPLAPVNNPGNAALYKADGSLDAPAAKNAYHAMMLAFGYPVPAVLKTDQFWVSDFVQRDMEKLGMGGIFWINETGQYAASGTKAYKGDFKDQRFGYLGHEIYLLPGQMLPEHRHVGGNEGHGPKMEAWHVRYGTVEFFGEHKGAGDETLIADMPAARRPWGYGQPWFRAKYVAKRSAGQIYKLADPESWHFQRAGTNGAIVSEYATYHNEVNFSKPGMKFASSEKK
jgi:D-lyxose ketol-isomerase